MILDATHSRADGRAEALRVASEAGVPAVLVELQLSADTAFARLASREREAGTEVDERAYREHIERFEAVQAGETETQIVLDAAQPPASLALEIAAALPSSEV